MSNTISLCAEQTEASIIESLNNTRRSLLDKDLSSIRTDYMNSNKMLNAGTDSIDELIRSNRGGSTGLHGFIGERAQVFLTNSMTLVRGEGAHYSLIDDNGPTDYLRDNIMIQQKACRSGGCLGLDQIKAHADHYAFYVTSGGIYQIPKDFYERYRELSFTPEEIARKWIKEDYRQWIKVTDFNRNNSDITIEPMNFRYDEIQTNTIKDTIQRVKTENTQLYKSRRAIAIYMHRPTYNECLKSSSISAIIDGSLDGSKCIYDKLMEKKFSEFNISDAKDITLSTLKGAGSGALRSSAVYFITNTTKVSAPTATATVSATCNLAKETKDFTTGKITTIEYAENTAWICADVAVSVMATKIGSKYIQKMLPGKLKALGFLGPLISNSIIIPTYNKAKTTIIAKSKTKEESNNE